MADPHGSRVSGGCQLPTMMLRTKFRSSGRGAHSFLTTDPSLQSRDVLFALPLASRLTTCTITLNHTSGWHLPVPSLTSETHSIVLAVLAFPAPRWHFKNMSSVKLK